MRGSGLLMAYLGDWRTVTLDHDEMLTTAEMFLRDAQALHGSTSKAQYFLIADAIELALSSFLRRKGARRQSANDIVRLLVDARSQGLTTSHFLTDSFLFRLKEAA